MDMPRYRRKRLRELIDSDFSGSRKAFCDKAGISESRLSQLLSETYRGGGEFGENAARNLEKSADLPNMYFDVGATQRENIKAVEATRTGLSKVAELVQLYALSPLEDQDAILEYARDLQRMRSEGGRATPTSNNS